jgi:hypothetical protein
MRGILPTLPTLDELTAAYGSRLWATVQRARYFKTIRPPLITEAPPVEGMGTLQPHPDRDSDDLLDGAPDVRILYVEAGMLDDRANRFDLRRPHPQIEGLIAWKKVGPETVGMLPGLRFLQLAAQSMTPEVQAALPECLEEIWASPIDIGRLPRLRRLRYLKTTLRSGGADQARALAEMSELRQIDLEVGEALRGANAFGGLPNLESLSINSVSKLDFKAFSGCRQLRSLELGGLGSTKSLEGIEHLHGLTSISISGRRPLPLGPLRGLRRLEHLSLTTLEPPPDVEVIGQLIGLTSLFYYPGSVSSVFTVATGAMFSKLERLRSLKCMAFLGDGDLTPFARLERLEYLCFLGTFPEAKVRWLQERLPACKLDLTVGEPPSTRPEIEIGPLKAWQEGDETWSVFQDLRLILDCPDNHAVEDSVRAELHRAQPEALARVEFDSENDAFAATLKDRGALEALAAAVGTLANTRRRR